MDEKQKWIGSLVTQEVSDAAKFKIESASSGDANAGLDIVKECVIALRDVVTNGVLPNAERQSYLTALLASLERIVDGADPVQAMCLDKQAGRPIDRAKEIRDINIFIHIGLEHDKLIQRGQTKIDKPVESALKSAVKRYGVKLQTAQKVWSEFGSLQGWNDFNSDWK